MRRFIAAFLFSVLGGIATFSFSEVTLAQTATCETFARGTPFRQTGWNEWNVRENVISQCQDYFRGRPRIADECRRNASCYGNGGGGGGWGSCRPDGYSCYRNPECCSGACVNGSCGYPNHGSCSRQGEYCRFGSDCCSGNCNWGSCVGRGPGPGPGPGFCRQYGEWCNSGRECCSRTCGDGRCR